MDLGELGGEGDGTGASELDPQLNNEKFSAGRCYFTFFTFVINKSPTSIFSFFSGWCAKVKVQRVPTLRKDDGFLSRHGDFRLIGAGETYRSGEKWPASK